MEISKLIADNISKHNGIFTFAALAGEDELLLDYLIEDICSYINRPVLDANTIELEKGLYSDSVYCIDYNNSFIKEKYDDRIFNSALNDISAKNNISFIIKTSLYNALEHDPMKRMRLSVPNGVIINSNLIYASNYVCSINGGLFRNQKNRYDMDGLVLNIKALIRDERMKKVLN
jgi:hypothetical protein